MPRSSTLSTNSATLPVCGSCSSSVSHAAGRTCILAHAQKFERNISRYGRLLGLESSVDAENSDAVRENFVKITLESV